MPKRAAEDQYDSDDGFVEDAPKSKKSKQVKAKGTTGMQKGDDGSLFWEIPGSKRRVVISEYRGTTMVNIREYYTKDGETKPGKGIALTVDQFHDFINLLPDVGSVLKEKGFDRPWPSSRFDTRPKRNVESADEGDAAAGNGKSEEEPKAVALEDSGVSKSSKSKLDKFKHQAKKNHEATSEEDED